MNKTNVPKDPKLPLSKTSRKAFERRYQELFLREAEEGVSDEKLMKAVNDYESKSNPNPEQQKQEGIQTKKTNVSDGGKSEEGNTEPVTVSSNKDWYKNITGKDADESWDNEKVLQEIESFKYEEAVKKYFELTRTKPPIAWTTEEINYELVHLETRNSVSNKYFDLFGMKPIDSMTNEQIASAIEAKEAEIQKANEQKPEPAPTEVQLGKGQVLATNKVTGESKVFNKHTLKYLLDWEETPIAPKEIRK